jgi:hypothetical protein
MNTDGGENYIKGGIKHPVIGEITMRPIELRD